MGLQSWNEWSFGFHAFHHPWNSILVSKVCHFQRLVSLTKNDHIIPLIVVGILPQPRHHSDAETDSSGVWLSPWVLMSLLQSWRRCPSWWHVSQVTVVWASAGDSLLILVSFCCSSMIDASGWGGWSGAGGFLSPKVCHMWVFWVMKSNTSLEIVICFNDSSTVRMGMMTMTITWKRSPADSGIEIDVRDASCSFSTRGYYEIFVLHWSVCFGVSHPGGVRRETCRPFASPYIQISLLADGREKEYAISKPCKFHTRSRRWSSYLNILTAAAITTLPTDTPSYFYRFVTSQMWMGLS